MIDVEKAAAPSSLPPGGGSVTFTYAVHNHGTSPLINVTVVDDTCAPVTFTGGDTNANSVLNVTETWMYTCTTTLTATTTNTALAQAIHPNTGATTTDTAQTTVTVEVEQCAPSSTDPRCVPPPTCGPGTSPACPPTPSTLVYECFQLITSTRNPGAIAMLTTRNFGNDSVIVRKSERMCEPALKTTGQPPTGVLAPELYPNSVLRLTLRGPGGQTQQVVLDGTTATKRMAQPKGPYDTELLQLSLHSAAPLAVHNAHGLGDSFFDVHARINPTVVSPGRADSFFDIWIELDLAPSPSPGSFAPLMKLLPPGALRFVHRNPQELQLFITPQVLTLRGEDSGWSITDGTLVLNPTTQANWRVYECFTIQRGTDPDDVYTLTTKNFGTHRVLVNRATRMCEGAIKSRQTIPANVNPQPVPSVWECFDITSGSFRARSFWLQTRNFGREQVRVLKPHSLCEEARKVRLSSSGGLGQTIGQPTGRVLECFTIEAPTHSVAYFLRTRNFGLDTVRIGRGNLLCEEAVKQPGGRFSTN